MENSSEDLGLDSERMSCVSHDMPVVDAADVSRMDDEAAECGLLDIVEAFTAMRHDWRGQSRETRELGQDMVAAVEQLRHLENELRHLVGDGRKDVDVARRLAEALVELDAYITRGVETTVELLTNFPRRDLTPLRTSVTESYQRLGVIRRWLCRPWLVRIDEQFNQFEQQPSNVSDATIKGLTHMLTRIRHAMTERQIERIDTIGKPFDPERMNAVDAVDSASVPRGYVVEQLSPVYLWRGNLLRFADVRVAK